MNSIRCAISGVGALLLASCGSRAGNPTLSTAAMTRPVGSSEPSVSASEFVAAVSAGNDPQVRVYIAAKADVNAKTQYGATALAVAAAHGDLDLVKALLAAGAEVDEPANVLGDAGNGTTALMLAAWKGEALVVKALLRARAGLNIKSARGETALMLAIGHTDVLRLLLDAGADRSLKDATGQTAFEIAATRPNLDAATLLFDRSADKSSLNRALVSTASHVTCEECAATARLLLDAGADVNAMIPHDGSYLQLAGATALTEAAKNGNTGMVRLLLAAGAAVDMRDSTDVYVTGDRVPLPVNHGTALIHAAAAGRLEVVKVLLAAGANAKAIDYWGRSALDAAKKAQHLDVAELLTAASKAGHVHE